MEEVFATLSEMNDDKTLWLDGITTVFGQTYWDVVKDDIMRMFGDFY